MVNATQTGNALLARNLTEWWPEFEPQSLPTAANAAI
jgi:hypothetical protein